MRGKFNVFLLGVLFGALLIILIYFADEIKQLIGKRDWVSWILLITTGINTGLIVYILRLTKNNNDKGDSHD